MYCMIPAVSNSSKCKWMLVTADSCWGEGREYKEGNWGVTGMFTVWIWQRLYTCQNLPKLHTSSVFSVADQISTELLTLSCTKGMEGHREWATSWGQALCPLPLLACPRKPSLVVPFPTFPPKSPEPLVGPPETGAILCAAHLGKEVCLPVKTKAPSWFGDWPLVSHHMCAPQMPGGSTYPTWGNASIPTLPSWAPAGWEQQLRWSSQGLYSPPERKRGWGAHSRGELSCSSKLCHLLLLVHPWHTDLGPGKPRAAPIGSWTPTSTIWPSTWQLSRGQDREQESCWDAQIMGPSPEIYSAGPSGHKAGITWNSWESRGSKHPFWMYVIYNNKKTNDPIKKPR